jgi:hypothetical protein
MNSDTLGFAMQKALPGYLRPNAGKGIPKMTEIGDLALLGDRATAALVGRTGASSTSRR